MGKPIVDWRGVGRLLFAVLMAVAVLMPPTTLPVSAETGDRTLYIYHTHTHETARITFKRNGVYDPKGLQQLDWILRDFRNNQPTEMSPELFDLVWEIYQKVGATQPINIVSAYRSPETNSYLRSHSNGVANNSQHMLGHAMDIFIPGVPLTTLRGVAMQQQVGGVGFYPTSASPFVHVDVGTVRAWPRMTEAQLQTIFPDGKTLHVPDNGHLLSQAGYAYAQAQWNTCHAVPCTNPAALKGGPQSMGHASMVDVATTSLTGKTFNDIHRGVNPGDWSIRNPGMPAPGAQQDQQASDESDDATVTAGPAETAVATIAVAAPIPLDRPAALDDTVQVASIDPAQQPATLLAPAGGEASLLAAAAQVPFDKLFPDAYAPGARSAAAALAAATAGRSGVPPVPADKSPDMVLATGAGPRGPQPQSALGAIASVETPVPSPRPSRLGDVIVTAYAPIGAGTPAEQKLQSIIESETTGSIAMAPRGGTALTNTVSSPLGADALTNYAAARADGRNAGQLLASIPVLASFTTRDTQLVAPGYDARLVQPAAMSSGAFALFVEPAATDLDPATELGPMVMHLNSAGHAAAALSLSRFAPASLLVASR